MASLLCARHCLSFEATIVNKTELAPSRMLVPSLEEWGQQDEEISKHPGETWINSGTSADTLEACEVLREAGRGPGYGGQVCPKYEEPK